MVIDLIRSCCYFVLFWFINILFAPIFIITQNSSEKLKNVLWYWARAQRQLLNIIGIKIQYRGFVKGNYLYCGQHQSYVDAIVFLAEYPEARCIATEDIKKFPLVSKICTNLGFLFVSNRGKNLQNLLDQLDNSRPILIFPEGKLTTVGDPLIIKSGFFHIAQKTNHDVVVFSTNMGNFSPKNDFLKKPGIASINFSHPKNIREFSLIQAKNFIKDTIRELK